MWILKSVVRQRFLFKQFNNQLHLSIDSFICGWKHCNILIISMSSLHNLIKPPETVRGMIILDRSKFDTHITVPFLNVKDVMISNVMPIIKQYCLKVQHLKTLHISSDENGVKQTGFLLNPEIVKCWNDISISHREALSKLSIMETDLSSKNITLKYENFLASAIFRSILPSDVEGFSSFSQIGHIIHLNLREHLLPYKNIIANVLMDKIPNARTVINKLDIIENTYRNFQKELLCGEDDMMVKVKQNRCEFEFDFSSIYWNPRLTTEHERIVNMLNAGDVLFDIFAGVGPFSVPAAKKKCIVYANDLNPDSYKWLNHNAKLNKIDEQYLKTFNKDGRDFILCDLKSNLIRYINKNNITIVMNLPALAVEFLPAFNGLYNEDEIGEITNPIIVHVYCFAKGENCKKIARDLVIKNVGIGIIDKITNIFKVRTVSSFKEMIRVSFTLDRNLLVNSFSNKRKCDGSCDDDSSFTKKIHA